MSFFIAKILNLFENMPFRIIKKNGHVTSYGLSHRQCHALSLIL